MFDRELEAMDKEIHRQAAEIKRLREERDDIIRSAMLAVSVGGRAHPNRLRSLATHRAIELAIEAAEAKGEDILSDEAHEREKSDAD